MIRPGIRNSLTDVAGIAVGNAEEPALLTGVTVVIPERPAVAAVDVRGGGPGTRETDALAPDGTIAEIHGLALSGGSAFGLDAAGGVMDWLRAAGRGIAVADARVPIVPAAILFDLGRGGATGWERPPWWELGRRAAEAAGPEFALGNAGAGLGARAGALKGGLGTASVQAAGFTVGALAAVNSLGSVVMPGTATPWAWALEMEAEWGGLPPPSAPIRDHDFSPDRAARGATTLGVIATDAALTRDQARRLAVMAQAGLARAIRPIHTPLDGDVVFALATGRVPLGPDPVASLARLGHWAADCLARAATRGVIAAAPVGGIPAWRDFAMR